MRPPATTGATNTAVSRSIWLSICPVRASAPTSSPSRRHQPKLAASQHRPVPSRAAGKLRHPAHLAVGAGERHQLAARGPQRKRCRRRPTASACWRDFVSTAARPASQTAIILPPWLTANTTPRSITGRAGSPRIPDAEVSLDRDRESCQARLAAADLDKRRRRRPEMSPRRTAADRRAYIAEQRRRCGKPREVHSSLPSASLSA